jgi:LacI family transcriptional regulator
MGARGFKPLRRERAVSRIEKLIRENRLWGRRLPAERELAARLGVSRGTLQRALEELEAKGSVERRHGSGTYATERGRAGRSTKGPVRICLLSPSQFFPDDGSWSYYGDMVRGALRGGRRAGVEVVLQPLEQYWNRVPARLWSRLRDFQGYIVVERDDNALMSALLDLGRGPVVALDSHVRDLPVIGVVDGSFEGARKAVRHLLRQGHRRIAFIAPGEYPESPHEKTQGYRAALGRAGVPLEEGLFCSPGYVDVEKGTREGVGRFLGLEEPPTAIFAGTDNRALMALAELESRGVRVGEEVALVGFGDSAYRRGRCDRLTSVRIHTRRMGEAAVRAVLESRGRADARTVIVPDRLIVRATTRRPGTAARLAGSRKGD